MALAVPDAHEGPVRRSRQGSHDFGERKTMTRGAGVMAAKLLRKLASPNAPCPASRSAAKVPVGSVAELRAAGRTGPSDPHGNRRYAVSQPPGNAHRCGSVSTALRSSGER